MSAHEVWLQRRYDGYWRYRLGPEPAPWSKRSYKRLPEAQRAARQELSVAPPINWRRVDGR